MPIASVAEAKKALFALMPGGADDVANQLIVEAFIICVRHEYELEYEQEMIENKENQQ